jgi:hypothetical protein
LKFAPIFKQLFQLKSNDKKDNSQSDIDLSRQEQEGVIKEEIENLRRYISRATSKNNSTKQSLKYESKICLTDEKKLVEKKKSFNIRTSDIVQNGKSIKPRFLTPKGSINLNKFNPNNQIILNELRKSQKNRSPTLKGVQSPTIESIKFQTQTQFSYVDTIEGNDYGSGYCLTTNSKLNLDTPQKTPFILIKEERKTNPNYFKFPSVKSPPMFSPLISGKELPKIQKENSKTFFSSKIFSAGNSPKKTKIMKHKKLNSVENFLKGKDFYY